MYLVHVSADTRNVRNVLFQKPSTHHSLVRNTHSLRPIRTVYTISFAFVLYGIRRIVQGYHKRDAQQKPSYPSSRPTAPKRRRTMPGRHKPHPPEPNQQHCPVHAATPRRWTRNLRSLLTRQPSQSPTKYNIKKYVRTDRIAAADVRPRRASEFREPLSPIYNPGSTVVLRGARKPKQRRIGSYFKRQEKNNPTKKKCPRIHS